MRQMTADCGADVISLRLSHSGSLMHICNGRLTRRSEMPLLARGRTLPSASPYEYHVALLMR